MNAGPGEWSTWLAQIPALRLTGAVLLAAAWGGLSWQRWRRAHPRLPTAAKWIVTYASQTGTAAALAEESAVRLGAPSPVPLDALPPERLAAGGYFLLILATSGEGEAPDNGRRFLARLARMPQATPTLANCRFAVLALGDERYPDFCAFGLKVASALTAAGAQALQAPVLVNREHPPSIERWFASLAGQQQRPASLRRRRESVLPAASAWRLQAREHLNPGSPGGAVYRLTLAPASGELPQWQAGDLARIELPGWSAPREYSIASLPSCGSLQLLVRLQHDIHGRPGLASNFLTQVLRPGECLPLQVRTNPLFHSAEHAGRPLILIGNGVGLAGLLAHARQAAPGGGADEVPWVLFGERSPSGDAYAEHLLAEALLAQQVRLDQAFSQAPEPAYVQHLLPRFASELVARIARGAAIYVCGSRQRMAAEVDLALRSVLGDAEVDALCLAGRYRRDVF